MRNVHGYRLGDIFLMASIAIIFMTAIEIALFHASSGRHDGVSCDAVVTDYVAASSNEAVLRESREGLQRVGERLVESFNTVSDFLFGFERSATDLVGGSAAAADEGIQSSSQMLSRHAKGAIEAAAAKGYAKAEAMLKATHSKALSNAEAIVDEVSRVRDGYAAFFEARD